mmetsp:Transcript_17872/g.35845  ORF Transcript_17872/g.35845 Transcript_17872/m.35845 type:complete len:347 (-) Transcript_17872:187-1227(-)
MRETFRLQNPGMTFGQLSKFTSAMYAELAPHEKEAWLARAEADKERYLTELEDYQPQPGYDMKGDLLTSLAAPVSGRPPKQRDPHAPKRNLSAYLLYQNHMRDQFKIENPGMTFGQLSKYTSAMYKSLSPEERARWDSNAAQDKERFDAEMANYTPPAGYNASGTLISHQASSKRTRKLKDPNAPKRARGSFVFFTLDARPQIIKENPGIKFTDVGVIMGEKWRALSTEEKEKYEAMAQQDKKRFNDEMEAYTKNKQANIAAEKAKFPPAAAYPHYAQSHPPPPHHYAEQHPEEHAHPQYAEHSHYYQGHYADPNAEHPHKAYHDYYAQNGHHYDPHGYQYPPPPP